MKVYLFKKKFYQIFAKCIIYFLRNNYGMDAKIHNSSIRLHVLGQTTRRRGQVSHSWLGTIEGFGTSLYKALKLQFALYNV